MDEFFKEVVELFDGIFFEKVIRFSSFWVTLDALGPGYFDFVMPVVPQTTFDFGKSEQEVQDYAGKGRELHWYLSNNYQQEYLDELAKIGKYKVESEALMLGERNERYKLDGSFEIEALTADNINVFVEIANICFPDYSNNEPYAKHCSQLEAENDQRETKCRSVFLVINGVRVAIGCVVYSKRLNLAYFNNFATLPEYRRKGYFLLLKKVLINESLNVGITRFLSINVLGGNAQNANLSMGFKQYDIYSHLELKEN